MHDQRVPDGEDQQQEAADPHEDPGPQLEAADRSSAPERGLTRVGRSSRARGRGGRHGHLRARSQAWPSMIHAVGYDAKTRVLEVVFNSGSTYCYEGVPPKVYKGLLAAESKGRYMRNEIIDVYPDYPLSSRRRR